MGAPAKVTATLVSEYSLRFGRERMLAVNHRRSWLEEAIERAALDTVAGELGMEARAGRSLLPCPGCGAEQRGSRDRRGPIGLTHNGHGWRCHRCQAGGDAIDMAAYMVGGGRLAELGHDGKARLRAWFAARGWCHPPPGYLPSPSHQALLRRVPIESQTRNRPPLSEVKALWDKAEPVDRTVVDPDVRPQDLFPGKLTRPCGVPFPPQFASPPDGSAPPLDPDELWPHFYLADRRFYAPAVAHLDVVRIMTLRSPWPQWPTWWPEPWVRHYRLVVRAFEPDGTLASLHARAVPAYDAAGRRLEAPGPKTRWPKHCAASGLIFADPMGLALLRGKLDSVSDVLITEGLTDFVSVSVWAAKQRAAGEKVAVLAGTSGSFPALAKVAWPQRPHVHAAVDHDVTGDKYYDQIENILRPLNIPVRRLAWARGDPRHG